MIDYFNCDALFFDMSFWPYTCYCENCRGDYRQSYGHDIPVDPEVGSGEYYELMNYKFCKMGEFIQSVTDHVKKRRSEVPFDYSDGYTVFRTRTLKIFDMYLIEL